MTISGTADLAVNLLRFLLGPVLHDFPLDGLIESGFQLWSVAKGEQYFKPDEERSKKDGLDQVVEEGWRSSFEDAMADELGDPREDMDANGDVVGLHAVGRREVIRVRSRAKKKWRQDATGHGFHENVKDRVDQCEDCPQIRR